MLYKSERNQILELNRPVSISKAKRKEEKEKRSREEEAVEAFLQILPPLAVSPLVGGSNSL